MWIAITIIALLTLIALIFIIDLFLIHRENMTDKELEFVRLQAKIEKEKTGDLHFDKK